MYSVVTMIILATDVGELSTHTHVLPSSSTVDIQSVATVNIALACMSYRKLLAYNKCNTYFIPAPTPLIHHNFHTHKSGTFNLLAPEFGI